MAVSGPSDSAWDGRRWRFPPELEAGYQAYHYANVRGMMRGATALMAALFVAYSLRDYLDTESLWLASRANAAPALCCLVLLALTHAAWFAQVWQPVVVAVVWVAASLAFSGTAAYFAQNPLPGGSELLLDVPRPMSPELLFYSLQACLLMVCFAALRLPFRWSLALQAGVMATGAVVHWFVLVADDPEKVVLLFRYLQPTLLVLSVVSIMAYAQERLSRRAYYANYLLDLERDDERRRREQTEAALRILNQAIGGVVHDLGNPLAAVTSGSKTLLMVLEAARDDHATIRELAEIIRDGGEMLDYLRVSLIEQTRVLEGKPMPVERAPASLRRIVEAGVRYQKPRHASRRQISIEGEDVEIVVDAVKLTTVFMNLVGNALKYSDGQVRVAWRTADDWLHIAVMDEGTDGRGLTPTQAERLFVAFGRLEQHARIEGIGLGLLSVQKVVEAHDGVIYIEGTTDGTAAAERFTTGGNGRPAMVSAPFRTAFVVALPLATARPAAQ